MTSSPLARNVCRPPSSRRPRPPGQIPHDSHPPGSPLLHLHHLPQQPQPRPSHPPIFAPPSSSPFQLSAGIHDEAPESARASRSDPLRTHARSVRAVCGPPPRCVVLPPACELLRSLRVGRLCVA